MRVLIWSTTLQSDILALAQCLDASPDLDLMLVSSNVAAFKSQPIQAVMPLSVEVWDRETPNLADRVRAFAPKIVIADNHLPTFLRDVRLFYMWHGLGWKARGKADLKEFYKNVKGLTGDDPRKPSNRFRAQCYGAPDKEWRVKEWQLPESSCSIVGCCYSDLLLAPPYRKSELQSYYSVDIIHKPVVLLSITWHYGRIVTENYDKTGLFVSRTGIARDMQILDSVLDTIANAGASCIFCLHDKARYDPKYLAAVMATTARYDNIMVKHKSSYPDNLADLIASGVMVSNLSSFITCFYYLGRPSVHVLPAPADAEDVHLAQLKRGRIRYRKVAADEPLWMNAPTDNGGLIARTPDEIAAGIRRGLAEPDCCRERSAEWLARHIHRPNGHTAERFREAIRALGEST